MPDINYSLKTRSRRRGIWSVIRNTGYILSGQGVQFVFRFVYAIILARLLGPHDYGLIGYGTSLYVAVLPVTKLGIEHVLIRVIGYNKSLGKQFLRSALPMRRATAYLSTLLFALAACFMESDPQLQVILICFSVALLGRSFAQWNLAVFTAYEANKYSFRLQAIFRPLEVVLGLLALAVWRSPLAVVLTHASVWWLETFLGTVQLRRDFGIPRGKWNGADLKIILVEAIPMCVAMTLTSMLRQGPLLSFKYLGGVGISVGNLALAMQVFGILSQLPIAANSAAYPVLSRSVARGDGGEVFYVETMLRGIIFLGTCLALFGMTVGPELVVAVFGGQFSEAGCIIGTALWMMTPWAAIHSLMRVQTARKHLGSTLVILGVGAIIFVLVSKPAISFMGIHGALVAALMAMSTIAFGLLYTVSRQKKINVWIAVIRPMLALFFTVIVFHLISNWNSWLVLLCAESFFIIIWFALGCFKISEMKSVFEFWKQKSEIHNI